MRAELEGVGEAGARGFGRLGREMEAANAWLAAFSRRVAVAAAAAVAAASASDVAMIRSGLETVDTQAKLAQSLVTTAASVQTLERAGELTRVSMSGIEQATKDLTRRLSQAAAGSGPAAEALKRLGLIWRGLSNQPAVAAAPALEAVAEAMAALASRTRPSGQAIEGLFDHMGRLVTYAGTAAAVLAGQWVAGLVAAWILGADRWPEARWADLEAQLRVSKQDETEPGSGTPAPAPKRTGPRRRTVRSNYIA